MFAFISKGIWSSMSKQAPLHQFHLDLGGKMIEFSGYQLPVHYQHGIIYLLLNSAMLQLTGIGDDYLFLNESMAENTSLLDFGTVYDYDYADHLFQESMRQKDDSNYIAKPYRGCPIFSMARLQINGVFHYANLCILAGYLYSKLEEFGFDKINEMIPHEYVDGKNHGKREGKGAIFDLRVDAGGLERQLDELKDRYYKYLFSRCEAILDDFDAKAPKRVYLVDVSTESEPHIDYLHRQNHIASRKFSAVHEGLPSQQG